MKAAGQVWETAGTSARDRWKWKSFVEALCSIRNEKDSSMDDSPFQIRSKNFILTLILAGS